jgi:translation elongation factor EF-4
MAFTFYGPRLNISGFLCSSGFLYVHTLDSVSTVTNKVDVKNAEVDKVADEVVDEVEVEVEAQAQAQVEAAK